VGESPRGRNRPYGEKRGREVVSLPANPWGETGLNKGKGGRRERSSLAPGGKKLPSEKGKKRKIRGTGRDSR